MLIVVPSLLFSTSLQILMMIIRCVLISGTMNSLVNPLIILIVMALMMTSASGIPVSIPHGIEGSPEIFL